MVGQPGPPVLQHSKAFCFTLSPIEAAASVWRRDMHGMDLSQFAGLCNRTALLCFTESLSCLIGEPERRYP
jgi:hypothetical protein